MPKICWAKTCVPNLNIKTESVRPDQLAWLRRPELDRDGLEIWERPDGKMYAHNRGRYPLKIEVLK